MADTFDLSFPDLPEFIERLQMVGKDAQKKIARRATMAGIRVLRDQVAENARRVDDPATPNNIAKNVAIRFSSKKTRSNGGSTYSLGIRGGSKSYANTKANVRAGKAGTKYKTDGSKSNPGGDTYYWRFLEFGTAKMPAKPIIRPALNQKGDAAIEAAVNEAMRLLELEIKRGS